MSSTKVHDVFSKKNVLCSKQSVVTREQESLADFVRRVRNDKKLSLMKVRVQSGYELATSYISRIENGQVTNVGLEKLRALAKGLGVSEDEVFAVARGKSLQQAEVVDAEMALFASRVKKLTAQQKRDFQIAWRMANELLDRLEREKGEQAQEEDRR
jgi:transcriptional regulator with XRE-family HTH domain